MVKIMAVVQNDLMYIIHLFLLLNYSQHSGNSVEIILPDQCVCYVFGSVKCRTVENEKGSRDLKNECRHFSTGCITAADVKYRAEKKVIESDLRVGHSARSSDGAHKIYCKFLFREQTLESIVLSPKASCLFPTTMEYRTPVYCIV